MTRIALYMDQTGTRPYRAPIGPDTPPFEVVVNGVVRYLQCITSTIPPVITLPKEIVQ